MDNLTKLIGTEIKRKYKSVRQFSQEINIPISTIVSALRNGVSGTGFVTIMKICNVLNISVTAHKYPVKISDHGYDLLSKYNDLDERGKHLINTIVELEFQRCQNPAKDVNAVAFGGNTSKTILDSTGNAESVSILNDIRVDIEN